MADNENEPVIVAGVQSPDQVVAQEQPAQPSPAEGAAPEQKEQRQRTQKEQELDALIAKRQAVIEQLKAKNPLVVEARKQLAELIPAIRGRGSSHVMGLVREEENIEFSIATEAYTPKKEKELLKRLREIRIELSKHKELDEARKKVDEKRNALRDLISDIRSLEHSLAEARKACDEKYAEVLAERKAAYSQRPPRREERPRQFSEGKRRSRDEHKREYNDDEDMSKYLKDYDDTVSMDEIVQIERKDKKEKKDAKGEASDADSSDSADEAAGQKEE